MEIRQVLIDELKPWGKNPRVNDNAVDAVAKSIQTFGFNVPILCDQDMTIIAGHVRWKAAKKLGLTSVPAIQLSLTRAQREAFAIADNRTAEIADWDYDVLGEILKDLPEEGIDLNSLGFNEAELDAILKPEEDFDWDRFREDLEESRQDATHIFLPVKVPIDMKQSVSDAIRRCAKERAIVEKDNSRLAGLVVMSLLGMSPCKSH
jgi:site-specific DNA-methyltransferase (adenine-specific)